MSNIGRVWSWTLTAFIVLLGCAVVIGMPLALFGLVIGNEHIANLGKALPLGGALVFVWWIFSDFGEICSLLPVGLGKEKEGKAE